VVDESVNGVCVAVESLRMGHEPSIVRPWSASTGIATSTLPSMCKGAGSAFGEG
jgi:hypothetical protein